MRRMEQYFPVPWTNPFRVNGFKFRAKIRNQTEDFFTFVYLLSGCSIDDAEVEINHVLGESDNVTFIVRI